MEQYSKRFLERNQPPFNQRFTIQKLTVSHNKLIAVAEVFQELARYQDLDRQTSQSRDERGPKGDLGENIRGMEAQVR